MLISMSTDRQSDSVIQIQLVLKNADIVRHTYSMQALTLHLYR